MPDHQANHRGIVIPERPAPAPRPEKKKEEEPKNMDELYDYIREKKAQDSLFYQEMFHSEKLRIRKDDVEKTRQYLKEREH